MEKNMGFTRRLVTAATMVCMTAAFSFGQAMTQVPAAALVVLHVKNVQDFSTKLAAVGSQIIPAPALPPPVSDGLGFLSSQLGIKQGLNATGDMAVALVDDGKGMNGPTPPLLFLWPTSDYKAFLSNYPNATTDAVTSVTTLQLPDGDTEYCANWGNYVAMSPHRDFVAVAPTGVTLTTAAQAEVDSHDACLVVNMSAVRAHVTPMLMASRVQILTAFARGLRQTPYAKYAPVFRVAAGEFLDVIQAVLNQCDDVTLGVNLGTAGMSFSAVDDFKPDSHWGQMIASEKNTDQSLLAGLPDAKYLLFGGGISDPKIKSQLLGEWLDPLKPELAKLGADGQAFLSYIQAIEDITAAQTGATFGLVVPEGELGTSPLMQFVAIRSGDAKALAAASAEFVQAQIAQTKTTIGGGVPIQMTFTPAAKTVGGVALDQIHTGFDVGAAQTPEMARIGQILSFAYGQDGLNVYEGVVNDTTYLQVGGLSDDQVAAAVEAAKNGTDSLSKLPGVTATSAQLPKQRMAEGYVAVDAIVNAAFSYMAKFGLDMGVVMPASDPIGFAVSSSGSAAHVDVFIPSQLLTSGAQVAGKLMMHVGGPGAPPGGAPPAGAAPGGGL